MNARLHRLIYVARMMSWLLDPRWTFRPPAYPIDRPIFLLGTQGGGLTLLSRMLRRSKHVVSAGGNSRYWTSADEMQNVYGPLLPAELTGLRYKAPPDDKFPPPRSWTYAVGELYGKYRRRASDATPELRRALVHAIRFSAQRHAIDKAKFRFLDKSQTFTVRVGLIQELLKDSDPRFVLVPRDPYVSVFRAAHGGAADMVRLRDRLTDQERIEICAEHYGNSMRSVFEDCGEGGPQLHVLPFERLLSAPEHSLRGVCEFVGLEFDPDMLPAAEHQLPIGSRFLDRWYPLRTNVNDRYDGKIDAFTIECVNHHCGPWLERLGYSRREPSQAAPRKTRAA